MSTHCDDYRNLIADAVTGTLDTALSRQLEEHLAACADCRGYYEALKREDLLLGQLVEKIDEDMTGRQQRLVNALKHHEHKQTQRPLKWRFTMI
jgi:anti-sigma factor RsiW